MMKSNHRSGRSLSLEMPIYDGSRPIESLLPDLRSRRIYGRLLHELIVRENRVLDEVRQWMGIELVLKALIIGEYMEQQGIKDIKKGIRQFKVFQHQQLTTLLLRGKPLVGFYGTQ